MKRTKKILTYTVVFELEPDSGGYTATVPTLPGCITEGDTFEETEGNVEEAILAYIESLKKHGEPIPEENSPPVVTQVKVTVGV